MGLHWLQATCSFLSTRDGQCCGSEHVETGDENLTFVLCSTSTVHCNCCVIFML